jgi:hypothetical protein
MRKQALGKALLTLALGLGLAAPLSAQVQAPSLFTQTGPPRDSLLDSDSFASWLDSAVIRSQGRMSFDDAGGDHRPTRAEYVQPRGGLPFSPGPPLPERNVDYQELTTYGEVVVIPSLSTFLITPIRFVNADVNQDVWGLGDISLGFKWAFVSSSDLLATFQLRATIPTAVHSALGTDHVSLEPALLFNYHLTDYLTLEGEGKFWAPIGGTDFAGNIVQYGVALSYGQRSPSDIWLVPVIEAIGWSVLDGKQLVPEPGPFLVENAGGTTIVNVYGGLRLGLGNNASIYAGYGRALTGPAWYKDIWRIELRFYF